MGIGHKSMEYLVDLDEPDDEDDGIDTKKLARVMAEKTEHSRRVREDLDLSAAETEASDLTTTERAELGRYEAVIKRGLDTFVAVGNALLAIRRDRLYRATHATFEAYCQQRWQMTPDYANKLVGAAGVVGNLEAGNTIVLPTTESQARPLTRLGPEQQVEAWSSAVEDAQGKVPTAAQVTKAAAEFAPPKPPKAKAEPVNYMPIWELNGKVNEWLAREIGDSGIPSIEGVINSLIIQTREPLKDGSYLDLLDKALRDEGVSFRTGDLSQAISNVRDQRQQARREAGARAVYGAPVAETTPAPVATIFIDAGKVRRKLTPKEVGAVNDEIAKIRAESAPATAEPLPIAEAGPIVVSAAASAGVLAAGDVEMEPERTPDERLGQAQLLRQMLVTVRAQARADYGELTGRHSDLLAWERDTELLIEPLDSLIEILSKAAADG